MKTFTLKECQQRASDELFAKYLEFHSLNENKKIYFQAPTGSGKTLILCDLCNKIMMHSEKCIILFISISTGDIQDQNYQKAVIYQKANNYDYFAYPIISPSRNSTKSNSDLIYHIPLTNHYVYFMGSSSYTKSSLLFNQKTFDEFIQIARRQGFEIVYIRDEAHIGTRVDNNSGKLDDYLNKYASITYYVSATLQQKYEHLDVQIKEIDAVNDGLIKSNLIAFAGVSNNENIDSEELLEKALTELVNVKKKYLEASKNIGQLINPCLLIQIQNKNEPKAKKKKPKLEEDKIQEDKPSNSQNDNNKQSKENNKEETEEDIINNLIEKITKFNLHYLVYTDERKESDTRFFLNSGALTPDEKYQITRNDSSIDVIIFKVALATGWDIPRANMLLQLRQIYSATLDIQTIGRIRRNPLTQKIDPDGPLAILDNYYIYSNAPKTQNKEYQSLKWNTQVAAFKNFATVILKEEEPTKAEINQNQQYINKFYKDLVANFKTKKFFSKASDSKSYHELLSDINRKINETNQYSLVKSELYLSQDQKQKASLITSEIVNTFLADKYWKEKILSFNDQEFVTIINGFVNCYAINESLNEYAIKLFLLDYNYREAFAHIVDQYNLLIANHKYYYAASPIFSLPQSTIEYLTDAKIKNNVPLEKEFRKFLYWVPDEENNDKSTNKDVDEEIYNDSKGEVHFVQEMLKVLAKINAKENSAHLYLLKNYLNNSNFRYEYIDKQPLEKKRSHYPDFVIEYNDNIYVCEIKSETLDYDENKTSELEKAYLEYSKFNSYHYLLIKWIRETGNGEKSFYNWNHYFKGKATQVQDESDLNKIFIF